MLNGKDNHLARRFLVSCNQSARFTRRVCSFTVTWQMDYFKTKGNCGSDGRAERQNGKMKTYQLKYMQLVGDTQMEVRRWGVF